MLKPSIYCRCLTVYFLFVTVTPDKAESEEEDGLENELENSENLEDCDPRKTIKVKPFGGPLLAQTY